MLLLAVVAAAGLLPLLPYLQVPPDAEPGTPDQIALGQVVYREHCVSCHGSKLEGAQASEPQTTIGWPLSPPLNADGHVWHHPDRQIFLMIANDQSYGGKNQSHLFTLGKALTEEQVWGVVAYVKSTWPARIRTHQQAHTRFTP